MGCPVEGVDMPDRPDVDRALDEISALVNTSVRLRAWIVDEGFTQVKFRNPKTGEVRTLYVRRMSRSNKKLAFIVK